MSNEFNTKESLYHKVLLILISSIMTVIGFFMFSIIEKVEQIHEKQLIGVGYTQKVELNYREIADHETRLRKLENKESKE